jgi:predicted PurR-regulated permease PerM
MSKKTDTSHEPNPQPAPDGKAQRNLRIARYAWVGLAVAVVVALVSTAWASLTPFLIGLVLLYLLSPSVNFLNKRLPRWLSILLVYLIAAAAIVGFVLVIVPPLVTQTQRLFNAIPDTERLQGIFNQLLEAYRNNVPENVKTPIDNAVRTALQTVQTNISSYVQSALSFLFNQLSQVVGLISFIVGLLIIPIWLFYVLNDQRKAHVFVNRLLHYKIRPDFWNAWGLIDRSLSAYIRGQLTLGIIIGLAVGIGLAIIDLIPGFEIDYILLLAIWAGICELIPMIGAILGGTPAVIIAFYIGGVPTGIAVLILIVVIQQLENNLLVPRIIGDSVGVHPAILTVALIVFGSVFGLPGVILAAPATAILRDLYLYVFRRLSNKTPAEAMDGISQNTKSVASSA